MIILNKDNLMYYVSNVRTMSKVYLNIPELIKNEELIVIEYYGTYYDGVLLQRLPTREPI